MPRRAALWTVKLISLITVAIVVTRHSEDAERNSALISAQATHREASAAGDSHQAVVETVKGHRHDSTQSAERTDGVILNPDSSGIQALLKVREVPAVPVVQQDLSEFAS